MRLVTSIKRRLHALRPTPWLVRRYDGVTLLLNPQNYVDRRICFDGGYERAQRDAFFSAIAAHECDVFLDVGSNFGLYSFTAHHHLPFLREIHAFECDRRNHDHFIANARLNGAYDRVHLHDVAVGAENGTVSFQPASLKNTGASHIGAGDGSVTVDQIRLDDHLPPHGRAAMKMDVEGAEMLALAGMDRWLSDSIRVIQIESFDEQAPAVHALLERYGFQKTRQIESDYLFEKTGRV